MRHNLLRIACIESLECLLSRSREKVMHAIARESMAYPIYQATLRPGRLITFSPRRGLRPFLNDDAMLRHSDVGPALLAAKTRAFLPSYRSSPLIERWTEEHQIELLSPPIRLQRTLEHKINFHNLLQEHLLPVPRSWIVSSSTQLKALTHFPLVCQLPGSEGMEGTFLLQSRRQLRDQLRGETLRLPLLCREFIDGAALGITIIVGAHELVLSSVRRQCQGLLHREGLAGVQWIPRRDLTAAQRRKITEVMGRLGRALRGEGFRGAASIDFILAGDEVLIIECNPRFSSATPQLSFEPRLLHGLDLIEAHCRAVRGLHLGPPCRGLPDVGFQGAYVDLSAQIVSLMKDARRRVIHQLPRPGVYDFHGGLLRFVSPDVRDLDGVSRLFFHYSTPAGAHLSGKSDFGSLFTNFPLFDLLQARALLTARASSLIGQLYSNVRFTRPSRTLADLQAGHRGR